MRSGRLPGSQPLVGILSIQGDVQAHGAVLEALGARWVRVRRASDLEPLDAVVLPGGESTTISKGLERLGLYEPLEAFVKSGRPTLGTCAGAVLLAREVESHPVRSLGAIDVVALRNAYGTQVDSFAAPADDQPDLRCVFIRAPQLRRPGPDVEVLARVDGWPVYVRQANVFATTFHPELSGDSRIHAALLAQLGDRDDANAAPVGAQGP